jgi:membrane-associated phospholipid phosphatase
LIGRLRLADQGASFVAALPRGAWLAPVERLAEVANGTPVWAASSAALAASGRRGRRAAAEGAVAIALASATSNLLAKPLVRRRRPLPVPRRGRQKTTLSFPSSHAATGFAHASAVALRWPAVGLPVLVAAAVVAGSRVHTRQHRIGDVLAGAVLGLAAGAVVHATSERVRPEEG